jgi:hypothetical protein
MNIILLLLAATFSMTGSPGDRPSQPTAPSLAVQLQQMNPEWEKMKMSDELRNTHIRFSSDKEFITAHFKRVEKILLSKPTGHLDAAQLEARKKHLDNLHRYYTRAQYPMNTKYKGRRPCFIDEEGTTCAVAQLLIDDGQEELARKISSCTNYAYIGEMNYQELKAWQESSGLTMEELGLIQPSYADWGRNKYRDKTIIEGEATGYIGTGWMISKQERLADHPESYMSGSTHAYGILLSIPVNKKLRFTTGAMLTERTYMNAVEGNFGGNSFGKIMIDYSTKYLSIPTLVTSFETKNYRSRGLIPYTRIGWQLGVVTDILESVSSDAKAYGAASEKHIDLFSRTEASYRPVNVSISMAALWGAQFGKKRRAALVCSPSLSYGVLSDKKSKQGNNSHTMSLGMRGGLSYRLEEDPKKKLERQNRRNERKKKEEEEKKRKQEERLKKKQEKEAGRK